jgi:glycosyltransferase involved in cell wall biosynthesis
VTAAGRPPRLRYIANMRFPTERAHGYQVLMMCEAFARRGIDVELWHPRSRAADAPSASATALYGRAPTVPVTALANVDIGPLEPRLGRRLFLVAYTVHAFAWAAWAAHRARREMPDLVYTRDPPVAFWLARFRVPFVLEVHVVPKRAGRRAVRSATRSPWLQLAVGITSFVTEELRSLGAPSVRTVTLHDAVDLDRFTALPDPSAARARLGLPAGRAIVGFVGRAEIMGRGKGLEELVKAVSLLDVPRPLLLCVGGPGPAFARVRALADQVGLADDELRLVDRVPTAAVPLWMRACDVLVLPSPADELFAFANSPMKLFEYMAAGVPILATSLPSIEEILTHRVNAWLVPPGDPSALANGLRHLLGPDSPGRRLAAAAAIEVKRHTWDARAAEVLSRTAIGCSGREAM